MALTKIKTQSINDDAITTAKINNNAVTDAKVADDITSGAASTAATLATARNINGVSFNGSSAITVTAAAGTLTGNTLASGVTASSLTSVGTLTGLTTSGVLSGKADATAGAPAYTFTGDTNTGIYRGGADQLQLATGGAERIQVNNSSSIFYSDVTMYLADDQLTLHLNSPGDAAELKLTSDQGTWSIFSNNTADELMISDGTTRFQLTDVGAKFAGNIGIGGSNIDSARTISSTTTGNEILYMIGDSGGANNAFRVQVDNMDDFVENADRVFIGDSGCSVVLGTSNSGFTPTNSYIALLHGGDIKMGAGSGSNTHLQINDSGNATFSGNQKITKHLGIGVDYHNDTTLQIENSDSSDNSYIIDGKHTATNSNGFGARFSTVATSSGRDILTLRSGASGSETNRFNFRADGSSVQTSSNQATIQHATSYHYHQSDMNGLSADNTFAYAYMYNVSGSGSGGTTARIKYSNEGNVDYDAQWIFTTYKQAIWAETNALVLNHNNATFAGALSKGSGSFKIDHPLPSMKDTHYLVHSFTESPRADLIYRDKVTLVKGKAVVNIDTVAGMTEGTFVLLCDDVQCFTSNESDWSAVKGSVKGNILTIECEDSKSTADVAWMVVADRKDEHIMETKWTDENGKPIVEPKKEAKKEEEKVEEDKDHPTGEKAVYKENA